MEVIITEWALNSYLELLAQNAFSATEYRQRIRPDVEGLKSYPTDPKFRSAKFWSPAHDSAGNAIPSGYKMKWHQLGNGHVQLRLPVGMLSNAFLCEAYVKRDAKQEKRQLARFKTHLQLIRMRRYSLRGKLP
ncbi:MAG: hypothetical protein JRH20_02175 [Deltaproteobacteria bacterium]|nr:hypothetical protein [Deltaproteobacteria bacterium]